MTKLPLHDQLALWLKRPLGRALLLSESEALSVILNYITGDYLVMLGSCVQCCLIKEAQFAKKALLTPNINQPTCYDNTIYATYESFPFAENSLHTVLLPHTLEFTLDPYQALQKGAKAVEPNGYIIIIGFNPWSLWGLRSLFSLGRHAPWSGHFRRSACVKECLRVLNFSIVEQKQAVYRLPFLHPFKNKTIGFFTRFCRTFLPILGGVYIIVAQKKTYSMTPIDTRWQRVRDTIQHTIPEPARRES